MSRAIRTLRNFAGTSSMIIGAAGLCLAGYTIVRSIPDIKRYIRISSM